MAKNADGPKSGRKGFGYEQAKEAGIPWSAISPRSISKVNADLRNNKAKKDKISWLLAEYPWLEHRYKELLAEGRSPREIINQLDRDISRARKTKL